MRLFFAADIDENIKEKIAEASQILEKTNADAKFVKKESLHVTLKFLGEVEDSLADEIASKGSEAVRSMNHFDALFKGMGYFGSPRFPKVIWIGVQDNGMMAEISKRLNEKLDYIRKEEREPEPHLTIARIKSPRNSERLLSSLKNFENYEFGKMTVNGIKLKKSTLSRDGAEYGDAASIKLGQV
ncbi:MAG: RNA 2',3'-cyclic phosphodiesterase [Candidatus Aenigmarchaeota archaeon]|nr:RNA 2',3'-cyclic phosphodiesterase [Candidatus Aenigmarchaeota archaeon]